jgi:hypothetical protein
MVGGNSMREILMATEFKLSNELQPGPAAGPHDTGWQIVFVFLFSWSTPPIAIPRGELFLRIRFDVDQPIYTPRFPPRVRTIAFSQAPCKRTDHHGTASYRLNTQQTG